MNVHPLSQTQLPTAYLSKAAVHHLLSFRNACMRIAEETGRDPQEIFDLIWHTDPNVLWADQVCYENITKALFANGELTTDLVRAKAS